MSVLNPSLTTEEANWLTTEKNRRSFVTSTSAVQARPSLGFRGRSFMEEPVRSGQSVIFPHGDVTVVGQVASGAEVVAGGSIHVYGALRGRALAGSMGNPRARIFCRKNEAELLAIDGYS